MKPLWALRLAKSDGHRLGPLRVWPGLEVLEADEVVWVRAEKLEEPQWEFCRRLPGAARFAVHDDLQLTAVGDQVPKGHLPQGTWQPLEKWLEPKLPPRGMPGRLQDRVELSMVRTAELREPTWLLASLDDWAAYVPTAPQARLARWSFVADRRRRVIVRGGPLPPLPGLRLVEQEGIAVPAGWTWTPTIDANVLREVLSLEKGDAAMWDASDGWQRIGSGDWVQTTRSAVRLTLEESRRVE